MTTSSVGGIQSLINGAESLISANYPSASADNVATLTWPSTVVIDGSTMVVPVTSTSTGLSTAVASSPTGVVAASSTDGAAKAASTTSSPTQTSTPSTSAVPVTSKTDRRLGIGLGVGITFLSLAIMAGVIYFLYRRKRKTGSYLRHQQQPDDSEIMSWRSGQPSWSPNHNTRIWSENEKYAPVASSAPHMATLGSPTMMSPAFVRNQTDNSSSTGNSNNPFYTPPGSHAELAAGRHSRQQSYERIPLQSEAHQPLTSESKKDRPPTPLLHEMMGPKRTPRPVERTSPPQTSEYGHMSEAHSSSNHNSEPLSDPFADPADDHPYYEPPVPAKSPDRRHSPQVHYPSGHEVSNFDFGLTQQHMQHLRHMGEEEGYQDGDDGWRSQHMYGR